MREICIILEMFQARNTNSGPIERLDVFHKNMSRLIEVAEKWNVIIGLESHGDIVNTAKDSIHIFKRYDHPLVRLNYDTGNTLFYNPGKVKIESGCCFYCCFRIE